MSSAQHLLDQIQSPARIAAAEADPAAYAAELAGELGGGPLDALDALDARDARLRHALAQLDAMIERAARIRIDHALADDASIATPTRKVFAATVVGYAGRLALLEARARDASARGGAADPAGIAERVVDAASAVLALRAAIQAGVLALVRDLAAAAAPLADRSARDVRLDEPTRRRWSAARRELEALASQPERITSAALPARLAAWPDQLDDPDPTQEPTFADMIELD
ncbi:MAG TPA: hypothetical protein VK601_26885 [Kofleriaceae bacterium]|nr:hypothetical protein [Kofleriaceae bacterium]